MWRLNSPVLGLDSLTRYRGEVMGKVNKQDDGKQGVDSCKNKRNQTAGQARTEC